MCRGRPRKTARPLKTHICLEAFYQVIMGWSQKKSPGSIFKELFFPYCPQNSDPFCLFIVLFLHNHFSLTRNYSALQITLPSPSSHTQLLAAMQGTKQAPGSCAGSVLPKDTNRQTERNYKPAHQKLTAEVEPVGADQGQILYKFRSGDLNLRHKLFPHLPINYSLGLSSDLDFKNNLDTTLTSFFFLNAKNDTIDFS